MTGKTTVIFDLDGTLVHSAPDMQVALNLALQSLGRGPLDLSTVISFVGNGVEKLVSRSLDATGGGDEEMQRITVARFLKEYEANGVVHTRLYDGVQQQLEHLADRGLKLGLCTNKPVDAARHICDALNLSPLLSEIVGAVPGQPKKPDPTSLMTCMTKLGASAGETIYVGDSAVDLATAQAACIDFCLYTQGYFNAEIPATGPLMRFDHWTELPLSSI